MDYQTKQGYSNIMALSLSLSSSAFRGGRYSKIKFGKLTEATEVPWLKVLPLALMTKKSTSFGKHKLTPYEFIIRQPMPSMIEPHAQPALVNSNMTQCFKV